MEDLLVDGAGSISVMIDERGVLVVPAGLVGVQPVDKMIVVHIPHLQQISLIGQERLP